MRLPSQQLTATLPVIGALCLIKVAAGATQKPLQGDKGKESPFTDEYGKHVDELLKKWHVPGVAIGVVDGDDVWTEGYGIATYPSTAVTPSTLFYCASTSKAFTAATLGIMIASRNYSIPALPNTNQPLDWTTPIADLIPDDFVLTDPWATTHVTLEDALSHRTGMPRHDKAGTHRIGSENRTATIRDAVRSLRYLPLSEEPRTKFQYCNHMYVVATHVIQALTGRWLGHVLREWIWTPLGMDATYFSLPDALDAPEHFAAGYGWHKESEKFVEVAYMPVDEVGGAGSVISNVDDYTKWVKSLLREAPPVPKSIHKAFKTPRIILQPENAVATGKGWEGTGPYDAPLSYAFGWEVGSYKGNRFWTHSGGMHAYGAEVFFFPDLDFGVVTLANTAMTSNTLGEILVWELVEDKLGTPVEERYDWAARTGGWEEEMEAKIANATDKYYPNRPAHSIPPALPIDAYTGTYFHPGYLNFTLELADPKTATRKKAALAAIRADATWPTVNEFEHVSGEYWMMYSNLLNNPNGPMKEFAPAQFRIGSDGKVEALGITWVSIVGPEIVEGLVWFDRI